MTTPCSKASIQSFFTFRRTTVATLIGVTIAGLTTGCSSIQNTNANAPDASSNRPLAASSAVSDTPSAKPEAAAASTAIPQTPAPSIRDYLATLAPKDPFRSLEQIDRPETQQWMKTQHDTSRRYLAELIHASKKKSTDSDADTISAPAESKSAANINLTRIQRVGTQLFYIRASEKEPKVVYLRENLENPAERTLIDISRISKMHTQSSIEQFQVSPNGRWIALLVRSNKTSPASARQILVADAQSGKLMLRPITNADSTSFLEWRPDSQALFYVESSSNAPQVVMRLLAGTQAGQTFPVFGPQLGLDAPLAADERLGIVTSPASPYTLAFVHSPRGTRIFSALAPQLSGNSVTPVQTENGTTVPDMHITWYPLIGLQDQVSHYDVRGDWFYAITRRQQPTGELVRLRLSEPRWEEADLLIPADPKSTLNQLRVAQDALYIEKRQEGYSQLIKLPYNARYQNTGQLQPLPDKAPDKSAGTPLPTPADQAKVSPVQPGAEAAAASSAIENASSSTQEVVENEKKSDPATLIDAPIVSGASSATPAAPAKRRTRIRYVRVREVITTPEKTSEEPETKTGRKQKQGKNSSKKQADADQKKSGKTSKTAGGKYTKHDSSASNAPKPQKQSKTASDKKSKTSAKPAKGSKGKKTVAKKSSRQQVRYRMVRKVITEPASPAVEQRRERVRSRVIRLGLPTTAPNTQNIKLPVDGIIQQLVTDPLQPGVLARMNDWTRPLEIVHIDAQHDPHVVQGSKTLAQGSTNKQASLTPDATAITPQTIRLLVPADDSANPTMLPVTLISKEGVDPAQSQKPLLLILDKPGQGFAAPTYRPDVLIWLKKGGVVALADLFPKGINDQEWLDKNQHILDSSYVERLENIVDYLYGEKIAAPNQLVAIGEGVNASLLGNLLATYPHRLAGAVLQSGVYDTVEWAFTPSNTAAAATADPVEEARFKRLWSVSSYHRIKKDIEYPGVLVLGSADRQLVVQAAKLTAHIQKAHANNHAYFYSAARPLSDETRLLFLWNQIEADNPATSGKAD